MKLYESLGEFLEESLEVKSSALSAVVDVVEKSEDELVLGIESEGLGGLEEISAISSSLSGVSVEGEESVEL